MSYNFLTKFDIYMQIYKCNGAECSRPGCYKACSSNTPDEFPCPIGSCGGKFKLERFVSFIINVGLPPLLLKIYCQPPDK